MGVGGWGLGYCFVALWINASLGFELEPQTQTLIPNNNQTLNPKLNPKPFSLSATLRSIVGVMVASSIPNVIYSRMQDSCVMNFVLGKRIPLKEQGFRV